MRNIEPELYSIWVCPDCSNIFYDDPYGERIETKKCCGWNHTEMYKYYQARQIDRFIEQVKREKQNS